MEDNNPYIGYIISTIKRYYNNKSVYQEVPKFFKPENLNASSQEVTKFMSEILSKGYKIKPIKVMNRVDDRVSTIVPVINSVFSTNDLYLLDIGAGDAEITMGLKQSLDLPSNHVYVSDPKTQPNPNYIKVMDMNHLNDKSFDIVLLINILHHVPNDVKNNILNDIQRVLKPGGLLIVREHDSVEDPEYIQFLKVYHAFWYVHNNESVDEMYLFPMNKLDGILDARGYKKIHTEYREGNLQRSYTSFFIKGE